MSANTQSSWNSLEVAKLLASLLTPVMVCVMGFLIQRNLNSQEQTWKVQVRLADQRLQVYDSIKDDLDRIYCFVDDVGTWKDENPDKIIGYKREIDRVMYENKAIWSHATWNAYKDYMDHTAFALYQGAGRDAKIQTTDVQKKKAIKDWDKHKQWSEQLTGSVATDREAKYNLLIDCISRDLMLETSEQGTHSVDSSTW